MSKSGAVIKVVFQQRFEEIKADIAASRMKFFNPPPEWTEKLLNITALNYVLLLLSDRAKWN